MLAVSVLLLFCIAAAGAYCPQGFTGAGDYCFHIGSVKKDLTGSKSYCSFIGGKLANLQTMAKFEAARHYANSAANGQGLHVACERVGTSSKWAWSDGSMLDNGMWASSEPNMATATMARMNPSSSHGFKLGDNVGSYLDLPLCEPKCSDGFEYSQGYCFHLGSTELDLAASYSYCSGKGGRLANLQNREKMNGAIAYANSKGAPAIHVACERLGATANWAWSDGTRLDTAFWALGEPNMASAVMTRMNPALKPKFHLGDNEASIKDLPLCEPARQCPQGFDLVSAQFCFHIGANKKDLQGSKDYCKSIGGSLVNLQTDHKFAEAKAYAAKTNKPALHVACEKDGNIWKWSDGTPLNSHKWASREPNMASANMARMNPSLNPKYNLGDNVNSVKDVPFCEAVED